MSPFKRSVRALMLIPFVTLQVQGTTAFARGATRSAPARKVAGPKSTKTVAKKSPAKATPKWSIVDADAHRIGDRDIIVQTFERVVKMGTTNVPVASVTHTVQQQPSNRNNRLTPQKVAEATRKAASLPPWITTRRGDVWVFETDHREANRYISLFYREQNGVVSVSISSIRRVYILPVLAETEALQKELAREMTQYRFRAVSSASLWDKAGDLLARLQRERILPEASAQAGIPVGLTQDSLLNLISRAPNATDLLNKYYNPIKGGADLNQILGGLQLDLSKFNNLPADLKDVAQGGLSLGNRALDQYDRTLNIAQSGVEVGRDAVNVGRDAVNVARDGVNVARDGVNVARDGVSAVNRATDAAVAQSDKAIKAAKDISAETNQTLRDISRETNENAKQIVKKMTSFETAFIMGLGGAVGAAVGTMVVSAVVSAGTWAVKSLWQAIFGLIDDETRKQINANTRDGLEQLERASKQITAIEMEVDKNIAALMFATGKNAENLAELAGAEALQMQVASEIELNRMKNGMRSQLGLRLGPNEDVGNPDSCALAAQNYRNLANGLNVIAPVLAAAQSDGPGRTREKLCQNITNLLRSWLAAEAELQVARGMVLDGLKVMMDETASKAFRSTDPLASDRRTLIACESKISDLKDKAREFDRANCSSKPVGTPECETYHYTMQSIEASAFACKQTDEMSRGRDFATDFMYVTEGLSHQMRQAQDLFQKLSRANCPASQCGEEGEFSKLRQRYNALLGEASRAGCPISQDLLRNRVPQGGAPVMYSGSQPQVAPQAGATAPSYQPAVPTSNGPIRLIPPGGIGSGGVVTSSGQPVTTNAGRALQVTPVNAIVSRDSFWDHSR